MKNNALYKTLGAIAIFISISSCSKDFLETEPVGKVAIDAFYNTDADALKGLIATYDILQWANARDWSSVYLVKTFPSDESTTGGSSVGDQPPLQELDIFTYGSGNSAIRAVFQSYYYGIYRANLIINRVKPETEARKQIIAEAQCLRGYFYAELVSMFGNVPLILTELTPSEYSQPNSTKVALYAQIEADLKAAIAVLPVKSAQAAEDKFRVSKGTAQSILGKVYLYQEKWKDAADNFDLVIASNEYQLSPDYSTLFKSSQEFGVESIFEVSYLNDQKVDWGTMQWGGNRAMEHSITWQLTGPRGDYFNGGTSGMVGGWGFNYPSASSYQIYVANNDIVRRAATVWSQADLVAKGGSWTGGPSVWGYNGYFRVKYGTFVAETGSPVGELNYGTNLRLLRYADVLLMDAEAYYRLGGAANEAKARAEIKKVRLRAGLLEITASGTALFNAIVAERQMELAFEGVRFLDLVRWGMAPQVLGSKGFVTGKNELYPIPLDEMTNNSKIVQNPGGY